jgi:excisionase family DNA binding protein
MGRQQEWMTPEEFREWLGIGRTKCYELLSRNEVPSYRVGKLRRIRRSDAERWLVSRRTVGEDR